MNDEKWTYIIADEITPWPPNGEMEKSLSALEKGMEKFLEDVASITYSVEDLAAAFEVMARFGSDISLKQALKILYGLHEDKIVDDPREALPRPPKNLLPTHRKRYIQKIRPQARSRLR